MTVAPPGPEAARATFASVRRLADGLGLAERSMGMTDDLEEAVAGAPRWSASAGPSSGPARPGRTPNRGPWPGRRGGNAGEVRAGRATGCADKHYAVADRRRAWPPRS